MGALAEILNVEKSLIWMPWQGFLISENRTFGFPNGAKEEAPCCITKDFATQ